MKYFLHDTNALDDEKITELYMEYGYEGVGLFYCILEKIAKQEKPVKTLVLKRQLNVGKKLDKCWCFMEDIGLISSSNGETFNKQLLNFSEKYQIKKEKNAKRISEWREKQSVAENVTRNESVRNTTKVKVSKVNRSKEIDSSIDVVVKTPTLYQSIVDFWLKTVHPGWTFSAQHGKEINSIVSKIKTVQKTAGKETSDESVYESFVLICENLPEWYKDKDLSIINSKFNEILTDVKNSRNGKSSTTKQHSSELYRS
jgi:hypothetical protein